MRRLPGTVAGESYLAVDAEDGLLDLHLLPANETTRDVVLALAAIAHPNLSRLRDAGVADGEIYIVEDHIEGVSLRELVQHGPMPGDVTLHVVAAVASALAEAEQLVQGQPLLTIRVPRLTEVFVSSVGQIKMGLTAAVALPSFADTVIDLAESMAAAAVAQAAGRVVSPRSTATMGPAAGIGAMVDQLLGPPQPDEGTATQAARELAEVAQKGRGGPGDCRALHGLAVQALRQTLTTPTGGFIFRKLSDLVERFAPRLGSDEAEVTAAGAQLLSALPEGTPQAQRVLSWYFGSHQPEPGEMTPPEGSRSRTLGRPGPQAGPLVLGQPLRGTPYKLLRKIGVGGMGIVFEAEHADLGRKVALKLLHGQSSRDPQALARFRQEARSAARIKHPHIVEIYDFGTTSSGEVFLVMELLEGQSLTRLCKGSPLPIERSTAILCQVCDAVEAAHQAGVIHRDLKPDNVMILQTRRPTSARWPDVAKVLDFGIAKLREPGNLGKTGAGPAITRQGQLFGTPEYMAPEQILGAATDHRVDVYALGCIAYELLTGTLPFGGESYGEMLAAHIKESPQPPQERAPDRMIPRAISDAVLRAIAKDPKARYPSMADFAEALQRALRASSGRPESRPLPAVVAAPVVPMEVVDSEAQLSPPRRPFRYALWSGGAGMILGLFGVALWIGRQPALPPSGSSLTVTTAPTLSDRPGPLRPPEPRIEAVPKGPLQSLPTRPIAAAPALAPVAAPTIAAPPTARPAIAAPLGKGPEPSAPPALLAPAAPSTKPPLPAPRPAEPPPLATPPPPRPSGEGPKAPTEPEKTPGQGAADPPPAEPAPPPKIEPPRPPPIAVVVRPPPPRYGSGRLSYTVQSTTSAYGRRDVSTGLDSQRRALEVCYQQAVRSAPENPPRGSGTFSFAINEDGLVMAGRCTADGAAGPLRACLEQVLLRTRFQRPEIGPVLVTIQLSLEPQF